MKIIYVIQFRPDSCENPGCITHNPLLATALISGEIELLECETEDLDNRFTETPENYGGLQ